MAEITPEGYNELTDPDVQAIVDGNETLNGKLRAFFLKEADG